MSELERCRSRGGSCTPHPGAGGAPARAPNTPGGVADGVERCLTGPRTDLSSGVRTPMNLDKLFAYVLSAVPVCRARALASA